MRVKEVDAWLEREGIESQELAKYLKVSKFAISKWRERGTIPLRLIPILEIILRSDANFLRQKLNPRTRELFE